MAISWGTSDERFQVGIDISQSPSSPSSSTSSVKLTVKFYVRTSYNSVNDTETLHYSGTGISSGSTTFDMTYADNRARLVKTVTATRSLSYSGTSTAKYNANLSGVFNGATPKHSRSWTVPKRPPGKPSAPGTPSISSVTSSSFKVSWSAPSKLNGSKITSYRVEVSTTSNFSHIVKNPTTTGRSLTITGLSANTKYYVRVRAGSTGGSSPNSGTRSTTTKMLSPNTPTSVKATRNSDAQATITWSLSTSTSRPSSSITVQRHSEKDLTWRTVASLSGSARSYTDKGIKAGDTYRWRVRANNSSGAGSFAQSNTIDTTPTAPSGLKATRSGNDIKLSWTTPGTTGSAAQIQIFEAQDGVWGSTPLATVSATATSWTHVAPNAAVTHTYRIRTVSSSPVLYSGYSTSQVVQLQAPPNAPTPVSPIGVVDLNQPVRLEWVHNPVDSSEQRQYQWSWRTAAYTDAEGTAVPAGAWQDQATTTSPNEFYTIQDPSTFGWETGQQIEWRVRTWGSHATASPWSATTGFLVATGPVVTITSPEDNEIVDTPNLTVEWDYFQETESEQVEYEARLYAGTDTSVEPTEVKTGSASVQDVRSVTFDTAMPDATSFTVMVRARAANGLWSEWDERTVSVSYLPPPTPTVDLEWLPDSGSIEITVTNPDPTGEEPPAVYNDVYRQQNDGEWVLIQSGVPINGTVIDPAPPLSGVVRYRAVAWSDLPSTATGLSDAIQFLDGTDPSCSREPAYTPGAVLRTNRAPDPQWVGLTAGDCSQASSTADAIYEANGGPQDLAEGVGFQHIVTTQDAGHAGTVFPIERTNLVWDPSFEALTDLAAAGWTIDAKVTAVPGDTTSPRSGTKALKWTVTSTVTDSSTYVQGPPTNIRVVEGQWLALLTHEKWLAGSVYRRVHFRFYDTSGAQLAAAYTDVELETDGSYTPVQVMIQAPAGVSYYRITRYTYGAFGDPSKYSPVGTSALVDDEMILLGAADGSDPDGEALLEMLNKGYFDGNTADGGGYRYDWTVGANNSPSTARPVTVADDTMVCGDPLPSAGVRMDFGATYGFSTWMWSKKSDEMGGAWEYIATNQHLNPREDASGNSGSFTIRGGPTMTSLEFVDGVETPDPDITTVRQATAAGSITDPTAFYAQIYSATSATAHPVVPGQRITFGWLIQVVSSKAAANTDWIKGGFAWRNGLSAVGVATRDATKTDMGNGWWWMTATAIVPEGANGALAYGGYLTDTPSSVWASPLTIAVTREIVRTGADGVIPTTIAYDDWFDGDKESSDTDRYEWDGDPLISTSQYYHRDPVDDGVPEGESPFTSHLDLTFLTSDGTQVGETTVYDVPQDGSTAADDTWYEVRGEFTPPEGAVYAMLTPFWEFDDPDKAPKGSEFGISSLIVEMLTDANGNPVVLDPSRGAGEYFDGDPGQVTEQVLDEDGNLVDVVLFYEWLGAEDASMSVQRASAEADQVEVESVWISGGSGFGLTCRAFYDLKVALSTGLATRTLYRFAGRDWPVEYSGTDKTTEIDVSFTTRPVPSDPRYGDVSMLEEWEVLAMEPGPHLYRDYAGRTWQCSISVVSANAKEIGYWECTIKVTRTDGDPNVDASILGVEDAQDEDDETGSDGDDGGEDDGSDDGLSGNDPVLLAVGAV